MPFKTGIEATKEILKLDGRAIVIMCSALGQESLVLQAIEAGAVDYLIKPFRPEDVLEVVGKALGEKPPATGRWLITAYQPSPFILSREPVRARVSKDAHESLVEVSCASFDTGPDRARLRMNGCRFPRTQGRRGPGCVVGCAHDRGGSQAPAARRAARNRRHRGGA